jgi:NAD(P)-dependent dehydrogenase (short-subunit alcohol dehydrogenase family)
MSVLSGKVAIITGGTSGIGASIATRFVEEGAKVVIAGLRREEGAARVQALGAAARFMRTDVADEEAVKALVEHALAEFGRLDCLINNAGIPGRPAGIADVNMQDFDRLMDVHVRGVVLGMKYAAPLMSRQGAGSIINVGSIAGLRAGISSHFYSAAKAAVAHLTCCVAYELAGKGVRVNSISPGAIVTGIFAKAAGLPASVADTTAEGLTGLFARAQPLPRAGMPDDIAAAAVYLASDASSFITGQDLVIDGGAMVAPPSTSVATHAELGNHLRSLADDRVP